MDCTLGSPTPVIGLVAYSGTGKTTLMTQLIPLLKQRGLRLAVIKHAHHRFDIDTPGKDSYEIRKAGAEQTLVASGQRWALITETGQDAAADPDLAGLLMHLDHDNLDLILVEGFKHQPYHKIELHRQALGKPFMYPQDPHIIALATDTTTITATPAPQLELLNINDATSVAEYIYAYTQQHADNRSAVENKCS